MRDENVYETYVKPVVDAFKEIYTPKQPDDNQVKMEGAYDGEEIVSIFWTSPMHSGEAITYELPPCMTTLISYLMDEENKSIEDALSFFVRLQTRSDEWGNDMLMSLDPVTRGDYFTVHFAVQGTEETGWDTHEQEFVFSDPGIHRVTKFGG